MYEHFKSPIKFIKSKEDLFCTVDAMPLHPHIIPTLRNHDGYCMLPIVGGVSCTQKDTIEVGRVFIWAWQVG